MNSLLLSLRRSLFLSQWSAKGWGWKRWAALATAYVSVYAAWLFFWPASSRWHVVVGNFVGIVPGALASVAALALARASAPQHRSAFSPRLRQAWGLLGLALVAWLLGNGVTLFYEVFLAQRAPVPSLANLFYLGGYCLATAGLLEYPTASRGSFGRVRLWLDMALTTGAAMALAWLVLVRPLITLVASVNPADMFWAAIYPMADLALLLIWLNVWLISGSSQRRSTLEFLAAGLAAFLIAHIAFTYLSLRGQYETGNPADLMSLVGTCLVGLGAIYQLEHADTPPPSEETTEPSRRLHLWRRAQTLLPLATTFALGWYTLLDWRLTGQLDKVGLLATLLLSLAVVARQGVVAGEVELWQYAQLVQSAADPAFICGTDGRLQLVNPAVLAATGYENESDLLGQPVSRLLALGQLDEAQRERLLTEGWSGEAALRRRDGADVPVYLSLRPVQHDVTARPALSGIAHDLTQVKQQEASLLAAYEQVAAARHALESLNTQLEQKVEEKTRNLSEVNAQLAEQNAALQTLDKLKSDFVSLVSHELRAPLTTVSGGIELLLADPDELTPRVRESLTLVQTHLRRLAQFVATILDLSALEAGRLPLYPEPLALQAVLVSIRSQLASGAGGDRLMTTLPADLPPMLADQQAVTSVIFHLIDNALKYAPHGLVRLEAEAEAGCVRVHILDEGPGIPPQARDKIFEKFERLDQADSRSVYGHGLGLYMSRELLRAMGGDIVAEESPGGGAQFTFWLPAAEEDHAE